MEAGHPFHARHDGRASDRHGEGPADCGRPTSARSPIRNATAYRKFSKFPRLAAGGGAKEFQFSFGGGGAPRKIQLENMAGGTVRSMVPTQCGPTKCDSGRPAFYSGPAPTGRPKMPTTFGRPLGVVIKKISTYQCCNGVFVTFFLPHKC